MCSVSPHCPMESTISDFSVLKHSMRATFEKILAKNREDMPQLHPVDSDSDEDIIPLDIASLRSKMFGQVEKDEFSFPINFELKKDLQKKKTINDDESDEFEDGLEELFDMLKDPSKLFSHGVVSSRPIALIDDSIENESISTDIEDSKSRENLKQSRSSFSRSSASNILPHTSDWRRAPSFPPTELAALIRRLQRQSRSSSVNYVSGGTENGSKVNETASEASSTALSHFSSIPSEVSILLDNLRDSDVQWCIPVVLPWSSPPAVEQVDSLDSLMNTGRCVACQMMPSNEVKDLIVLSNGLPSCWSWEQTIADDNGNSPNHAVVLLMSSSIDSASTISLVLDSTKGALSSKVQVNCTDGRLSPAQCVRYFAKSTPYSKKGGARLISSVTASPDVKPLETCCVTLSSSVDNGKGVARDAIKSLINGLAAEGIEIVALRTMYIQQNDLEFISSSNLNTSSSSASGACTTRLPISALFRDGLSSYYAGIERSGRARLVFGIRGIDAIAKFNMLLGPRDVNLAKRVEETSLNARFGGMCQNNSSLFPLLAIQEPFALPVLREEAKSDFDWAFCVNDLFSRNVTRDDEVDLGHDCFDETN